MPPDLRLERTRAVWQHHLIHGTHPERDGWYLLTAAPDDYTEQHPRNCEPARRTGPFDYTPDDLLHCLLLPAKEKNLVNDSILDRAEEIVSCALTERMGRTARLVTSHGQDQRPATLDDRLYLLQVTCDERRIWIDA